MAAAQSRKVRHESTGPPAIKSIRFLGSSRKELMDLGSEVCKAFGHALHEAQHGLIPYASKPLPQFGPKVFELLKDHDTNTYRCNIFITCHYIYILVAYKKKSKSGKEIPRELVELTGKRLRTAKELESL
ncbi:type II toxin-antitoxin system RelE/ParE family toxin [Solidesulfovibrio sp.]